MAGQTKPPVLHMSDNQSNWVAYSVSVNGFLMQESEFHGSHIPVGTKLCLRIIKNTIYKLCSVSTLYLTLQEQKQLKRDSLPRVVTADQCFPGGGGGI